jgi:uncharacterized membrane protein
VSSRGRRTGIVVLSLAGAADAAYMLAYHEGWIDSLVCPFFGEGCNVVGRSPQARLLGVPNAAVGLAGYAGLGALALALPRLRPRPRRRAARALAAGAGAAVAASVVLTWVQGAKVRAWCFWCLTSAALNLVLFPLALAEARE